MTKQNIHIIRLVLCLTVSLFAAACSSDSEHDSAQTGDILQLVTYTRSFADQTRAVPAGYNAYSPSVGTVIEVFMTPDKTTPGSFTYNGLEWHSSIPVKVMQYYIYGYMPGSAVSGSSIEMQGESYADGALLTLGGLSPVSNEDVCVITGIQGMYNQTDEQNVKLGLFSYMGQPQGHNYVNLLMDHIYAGLQFRILVNSTYNELRTIKLKSMTLSMKSGGTASATIPLTANTTGARPIGTITWTKEGSDDVAVTLFESEEGEELGAVTAKIVEGYVIPGHENTDNISLTCIYDVYDRKGNLIRKDCRAENRLPTSLDIVSLQAGERQPINLEVNPTYLYMLSDPELDNPTITVGN